MLVARVVFDLFFCFSASYIFRALYVRFVVCLFLLFFIFPRCVLTAHSILAKLCFSIILFVYNFFFCTPSIRTFVVKATMVFRLCFCPFHYWRARYVRCEKNRMCDVIKCLFMHLVQNDLYLVQRVFNFD